MKSADDIERLARKIRIKTGVAARERILSDAEAALVSTMKKGREVLEPSLSIWRTIMKSKITKLAGAAVVIIAAFVVIHQLGGTVESVAFADVVRPLLTAETGKFKMTIDVVAAGLDWIDCKDEPTQTIEVIFAGPARTRWDVATGEVLVANMFEGKVMILMPAKKEAAVMQVGPPGVIPPHNRFNKLLELRRLIQYALKNEDESVEFLGRREIDDVGALGYHITGPQHHGDITVWADAESKVPIRIEQSMAIGERTEAAVISDIAYDVEVDESLFSVEPPEGYSVGGPESEAKEPEFVVTGRVTDATTGEAIAGARVSDDGYGPKPYKGAVTDADGRYSYHTWPEEHRIKAEAPGYKAQAKGLKAGLFHTDNVSEKQVLDFALEPE
ncbi:MAG TPA: carboxypeptidase regulatory-like domain-containing protein [Sedimentisphaerales bacterium]|nr:carboxypeptidase regulatory-like domain-containing protein [Sedimentisphaerales bacterium]